jgi:hypothetical protein
MSPVSKGFAVGLVAGIGLVWGAVALVGSDDERDDPAPSPSPSAFTSPTPSPSPTPSSSPTEDDQFTGLGSESRLRLDGIGAIVVGMSVEEASAAANVEFKPGVEPSEDCFYVSVKGGPRRLAFMVLDGAIARVDVSEGSPVRTLSGIGIGSIEEDVFDTYEGRIREEPHPYTRPEGHYLVYEPRNEPEYSLIFETDGDVVTSFRSGFADPVSFIEGCS